MLLFLVSTLCFLVGLLIGMVVYKTYLSPRVNLDEKYNELSKTLNEHIEDFVSLEETKVSLLERNYKTLLAVHGMIVGLKLDAEERQEEKARFKD